MRTAPAPILVGKVPIARNADELKGPKVHSVQLAFRAVGLAALGLVAGTVVTGHDLSDISYQDPTKQTSAWYPGRDDHRRFADRCRFGRPADRNR